MEQLKKYSPALFALIIFCYLLPFYNISYYGLKQASITGLQIVIDKGYLVPPELLGHDKNSASIYITYDVYFARLVLLMAFLGLLISFTIFRKKSNKSLFSSIVLITSAVFLFILKNNLDNDVRSDGKGLFFIEYEFGYWLALLVIIISAVLQGMIYNQERKIDTVNS